MRFTVTNNALLPADDAAVKYLGKYEMGEMLHVTAQTDAEQKFRSFVFMALTKVATAADMPHDELRARLLIECGHFQMVKIKDDDDGKERIVIAVKSMNLQSMAPDQLRDFWDEAKEIIEHDMLPKLRPEDQKEIEELLK
jgi:hypothetical protein